MHEVVAVAVVEAVVLIHREINIQTTLHEHFLRLRSLRMWARKIRGSLIRVLLTIW
jgi:hypothetical protein